MPAGEPTLAELGRTLERMDAELNRRLTEMAATLSQMVTRDLYEAHRTAMQDDINELRAQLQFDRDRRSAERRMVVGAAITAVFSLIVAVVAAALLVALKINS